MRGRRVPTIGPRSRMIRMMRRRFPGWHISYEPDSQKYVATGERETVRSGSPNFLMQAMDALEEE